MKDNKNKFIIAQCSDVHCGDVRFDESLILEAIKEINNLKPDFVAICGDLSVAGYREQLEKAREYVSLLECPQKVIIPGNHDYRNVGYLLFDEILGPRYKTEKFKFGLRSQGMIQEEVKIIAVDSNKPDLNEGEIGRDHYRFIHKEFSQVKDFKIFMMHHHLISVPGTGRERNIVWDAGDVLKLLRQYQVDLVLCGHRHVPYIWPVADILIINCGTVSSWRTRGNNKPSYNIVVITEDSIEIEIVTPGRGLIKKEVYPRKAIISEHIV